MSPSPITLRVSTWATTSKPKGSWGPKARDLNPATSQEDTAPALARGLLLDSWALSLPQEELQHRPEVQQRTEVVATVGTGVQKCQKHPRALQVLETPSSRGRQARAWRRAGGQAGLRAPWTHTSALLQSGPGRGGRGVVRWRLQNNQETCQRSPQGHKAQKKKAEGIVKQ